MSTRGLIGIKQKNGSIRYIYNHSDSYPSYLMKNLEKELKRKDLNKLKTEIESGEWNDSKMTDIIDIDYLWHEYVYILDFEKKTWGAYRTEQDDDEKNNKLGKLEPILENIKFKDNIAILTKKNDDEYVFIIKKIIKNEKNYKILYDGKTYYLVNNDDEIIELSTNKTDVLCKGVSEKL